MESLKAEKGVPGFLLIPAREHEWVVEQDDIEIVLPKEGLISALLDKEALASGLKIPGSDAFSLFTDDAAFLYNVPRVLFALSKYPQLEDNQAFCVYGIDFEGDEIALYGAIIRFV